MSEGQGIDTAARIIVRDLAAIDPLEIDPSDRAFHCVLCGLRIWSADDHAPGCLCRRARELCDQMGWEWRTDFDREAE